MAELFKRARVQLFVPNGDVREWVLLNGQSWRDREGVFIDGLSETTKRQVRIQAGRGR